MNERVLVLDDEPSVQEVARAYLEREGFIVDSAMDGHAALAAIERKPPQLIVLDLMLPDVAGEGDAPLSALSSFDEGRLRIDELRHEVLLDGAPVDLTPTEFRLLASLASYPGRVYSRFELINRVQGTDFEGYERTIDAHVKNLRRKLEPDPMHPRYVQTVHGIGYRLGVSRG